MTALNNILLILCFLILWGFTGAFQCKNQENRPVDWFVVYKLPKQSSHNNKLVKKGLAYTYVTSEDASKWILSDVGIDNMDSLVSLSLTPLFNTSSNEKLLYLLYNDQPPYGSSSEKKGHTKGAVLANEKQGFWLIHSVPHFPYFLENYRYPDTGVHFGQSFLCISLDVTNLNAVGVQLQYNEPHIFAQQVPESFQNSVPDLFKAANNITIKNAPWYNIQTIETLCAVKFTSFAKSGNFQKDLYSDLVAFKLESNLSVETWPNEPDRLPSECDKFQVQNVLALSLMEANVSFKTTVDHSKWAVSSDGDLQKWICIGDINRAKPQTLRGGGTTCLNNNALANIYQSVIKKVQECQQNTSLSIIRQFYFYSL